jgi:uncharacterized protein YgiM (DUF1202 family)
MAMLVRTDAVVRLALLTAITATTTLFAAPGNPPATKPATLPAAAPAVAPPTAAAPGVIPPVAAAPIELPPVTQAFVAAVGDNKVNVRSGPGTAYYEMGQLAKGDLVYVVGTSKDWYKILPPNGTFCMIAKEFVDADAAASTGTVKGDYINVRAGTAVYKTRDPSAVLAVVRKGTRVRILGSTDQYYQIAPPEQAYVYVSSQFIKAAPGTEYKVAELKLPNGAQSPFAHTVDAPTAPPSIAALPTAMPGSTPGPVAGATIDIPSTAGAGGVETPGMAAAAPGADVPTVTPAVTFSAEAKSKFNDVNARYLQDSKKQLADQDVAGFTKEFQDILAIPNVSPTIQQSAQANLKALERTASLQRLMKEQAASAEMTKQQTDALRKQLEASQKLIDSSKENQPFINEGVLKSSTVVAGKYALVNPQTGRTVAYIDPANSSVDMSIFMNHYIGVRGEKKKVDGADIEVITVRDATLMPQPGSVQ